MGTDEYQAMVARIDSEPALQPYRDVILYEWDNWDEHVAWVLSAPVDEIVSWAEEAGKHI